MSMPLKVALPPLPPPRTTTSNSVLSITVVSRPGPVGLPRPILSLTTGCCDVRWAEPRGEGRGTASRQPAGVGSRGVSVVPLPQSASKGGARGGGWFVALFRRRQPGGGARARYREDLEHLEESAGPAGSAPAGTTEP